MSANLRRRIFGYNLTPESTPDSSRDTSPAPPAQRTTTSSRSGSKSDGKEKNSNTLDKGDYQIVKSDTLKKLKQDVKGTRGAKRRTFWIFVLGGLVGLVSAGFFASRQGGLDALVELAGIRDMNLDSILDVLPAGLIKEVRELQTQEKEAVNYDSFSIGLAARSEGIAAKYPVIMVPGVISTGLESWGTEEQSRQYFRKRLWGSWNMMRAMVLDKVSWKKHIMLDKKTGLDPPGIKLRAAQGFDAADFFITGYWIWNKILENLATIGYDPGNAFTAAYDWRLSYMNLERRDQYFSRLKNHIEVGKSISGGLKVVLLSHSMGSQVLYYFLHWVEAEGYGNGGPNWVNDHIESWINISGCMLGALKDLPAVLSGEMRDTAQLNAFAVYGLEKFLSRHERADIFRHMPGLSSMLPIGGEAVWGDANGAPDDQPGQNLTFGNFLNFKQTNSSVSAKNLTVSTALPFLFKHTEEWYKESVLSSYSHGVAHTKEEVEENQFNPNKWINPLETRLPYAPDLKIYCFYGVGKPTERGYFYREEGQTNRSSVMIDTTVNTPDSHVISGVAMGEGDGTVNLLSSGYMCNRGWKIRRYNPANISVVAYEMPHEPDRFNPRGGPNTGDHVDILGRSSLNDLILRVAGGKGHLITDTVYSNIKEYSRKVKIYDDDE